MTTWVRRTLAVLALWPLYAAAVSLFWWETLWGAHALHYFPGFALPATGAALLALAVLAFWPARAVAEEPKADGRSLPLWAPAVAGLAGAGLFWLFRVRHLFWGDALPLAINVPRGQAFHPDEPLTLFLHQAFYRLLGGEGPAETAVALGSVLAGGLFVARAFQWFSRRLADPAAAVLAATALAAQGYALLFFGYVENYSYLAVALLYFFTWSVDFLDGRIGAARPFLAAILAWAFHVLGALAVVASLSLLVHGLLRREKRRATLVAAGIAVVALAAAATLAGPLYGGESPLGRFPNAAYRVLTRADDMEPGALLSWRKAANLWSQLQLTGPLTLPLVLGLLALWPARDFLRSARGAFLALAAALFTAPLLFLGEGNLGAARNWDLMAAPAIAPALCALVFAAGIRARAPARRVLAGILVVSLFHTIPWTALNADPIRVRERVADLPLGGGRAPMMLGTDHLNAGELSEAERWFRRSIAEDSTNVNSQSGLGLALARQGRHEEALPHLERAVALKPASLAHRRDLATLWLALERWREAAAALRVIAAAEPRDRSAWLTLADCRFRLEQPDSAALELERALAHHPRDPEVEAALARAYELWVAHLGLRGEVDRGRVVLARFQRRFPNDPRIPILLRGLQGAQVDPNRGRP